MSNKVKQKLEWYHFLVLVFGVIYSLMNTTSVIINSYTCLNGNLYSSTRIYNITYSHVTFGSDITKSNDCFVESWKNLNETRRESMIKEPEHVIWGSLSLCVLALPGLFLIAQTDGPIPDNVGLWIKCYSTRNLKYCTKALGYVIILICYPITLLLSLLTAMLTNDVDWYNIAMLLLGLESFFQSLPQFLIQMFMVVNGFSLTVTQLLLLIISFTFLLLNCLRFDIYANQTRFLTSKDVATYGSRVLSQHVTGIVFRCCSLVLIITFFRYWGFIVICIYVIELMLVAGLTIAFDWNVMFSLGLTNIGDVNLGVIKYLCDQSRFPEEMNAKLIKFVRTSAIVTFFHHLLLITTILISVSAENCLFSDTIIIHWSRVVIYPGTNLVNQDIFDNAYNVSTLFYLIITIIISLGIINLTFTLYESRDIVVDLDDGVKEVEDVDSTENSPELQLRGHGPRITRAVDSFNSIEVDQS